MKKIPAMTVFALASEENIAATKRILENMRESDPERFTELTEEFETALPGEEAVSDSDEITTQFAEWFLGEEKISELKSSISRPRGFTNAENTQIYDHFTAIKNIMEHHFRIIRQTIDLTRVKNEHIAAALKALGYIRKETDQFALSVSAFFREIKRAGDFDRCQNHFVLYFKKPQKVHAKIDIVALKQSIASPDCTNLQALFDARLRGPGNIEGFDILHAINEQLDAILSVIDNQMSEHAYLYPRIEFVDHILNTLHEWMDIDYRLKQATASEIFFAKKPGVTSGNQLNILRIATRKKGASDFSCEQLLEFLFYPGKMTKRDIIDIITQKEPSISRPYLEDKLRNADIGDLRAALKNDVVNYIAAHGFKLLTHLPLSVLGSRISPPLAEALVQRMCEFAQKFEGVPEYFSLASSVYFAITSEKGLSPNALRQMDVWKMFEYEDAPLKTGDARSYEDPREIRHPDWYKSKTIAETMVGLLIQQAGMMPTDLNGKEVEYYDIENPNFRFARHHWWFNKESILLKDLILLGKIHNLYAYSEPFKPAFYREAMRSMKEGFELGQCPDTWSPTDKREYYSRLYDMIKEWSLHRDISQDWFKININGNLYSLNDLIHPPGGRQPLIEEGFVDNIVDNLIANIQRYSNFEFDAEYSDVNKAEFLEEFM